MIIVDLVTLAAPTTVALLICGTVRLYKTTRRRVANARLRRRRAREQREVDRREGAIRAVRVVEHCTDLARQLRSARDQRESIPRQMAG